MKLLSNADLYLLSQARRARFMRAARTYILFLPTVIAAIYYGLIAAPRYVSTADFVVRGATSSRASGLESFFRSIGVTRAADDANVVQQYILSRDAVAALQSRLPLRAIFSRPEADWFSAFPRFWESQSEEDLYDYYGGRVTVIQNTTRGISVLRAQAFRAEDAKALADELLRLAETIVNKMNDRALNDAVSTARAEVAEAETRLVEAQVALTEFRNAAVLVDPSRTSVAALDTISALTTDLNQTLAQVQETRRTAPASPGVNVGQARAEALQGRIDAERAKLAGDNSALAAKVSAYERLTLVRDLADKRLGATMISLENARAEAQRKQIYVERISGPNLPDQGQEPQRLRMVLTVLVTSFMLYAVAWLLSVGKKEHEQ